MKNLIVILVGVLVGWCSMNISKVVDFEFAGEALFLVFLLSVFVFAAVNTLILKVKTDIAKT